jgi:carbonic anhydrase
VPRGRLIEGFQRFRKKYYESGTHLMEKLAKDGAHPDFFVINCIDPRNGADLVFDAEPGQQFIHSQMAAIVPPYKKGLQPEVTASLSYAIDSKKIKHLIILGHSQCGGAAALAGGTPDQYVKSWVKMADRARRSAEKNVGHGNPDALWHETERQVVIMSFRNVLEYPVVKKAVAEGRLTVNGWFFNMEQGTLHEYIPEKNAFRQLNKLPPTPKKAPPPPSL